MESMNGHVFLFWDPSVIGWLAWTAPSFIIVETSPT